MMRFVYLIRLQLVLNKQMHSALYVTIVDRCELNHITRIVVPGARSCVQQMVYNPAGGNPVYR